MIKQEKETARGAVVSARFARRPQSYGIVVVYTGRGIALSTAARGRARDQAAAGA
jgi:ATP:corrinoid adenosyltransferase